MAPGLIKPPKGQRLPGIVTVAEAQRIFAATRVGSYRVFFFTLYSLGLRLGEGLRLQVGDIGAVRRRVHVRDAKGNRDRFVPLPRATHELLQRFWLVHRHPVLLFPNRHGGVHGAARATTSPLDRGGVQRTLRRVADDSPGIGHRHLRDSVPGAVPGALAARTHPGAGSDEALPQQRQPEDAGQLHPVQPPHAGTPFLWPSPLPTLPAP